MQDPTSSSSRATSCRRARARCRRGTTPIPRCSARRSTGCSGAMWILRRPHRAGRDAGPVLRPRAARREHHRHAQRRRRGARVLQRLPPSRHAALHRGDRTVRRQHPVPVSRVDLRPRRTADRRAAHGRSAALPQGGLPAASRRTRTCGTATSSSTRRRTRAPLGEQLGRSSRQVPQLADAGPPPRPPHRLRREGELEADHPELQRVPALPEPAPGAQQAVALPERRERAAAADLHGRPHGPAAGRRRRCRWTAPARARSCRGSRPSDRRRVYYYAIFPNMLLSLHPDYMMMHTLWPIAPDRTINVCEWHFHPSELARAGFDAVRRASTSGT